MTQKRGLGRGLGALIPGAGSAPAPEQELRTRTRPTAGSDGETGSARPVDMFFSGEKVSREEEKAQRERAGARDLATGMARAAAERRGRTGSTGGRRSAAARAAAPAPEEESAQTAAADAPARTSSSSRAQKTGSGKTRSTTSPSSGSRSTSSNATSSGTKSSGTKSSGTKSSGTKSSGTKSSSTKSTGSKTTGSKAAGSKAAGSTSAGPKTAPTKTATTSSSKTASSAKNGPVTSPSPAAATSSKDEPTSTPAAEPAEAATQVEEPTTPVQPDSPAERPAPTSTPEQPAPSADEAPTAEEPTTQDSPVVDVEEVTPTPAQPSPADEAPAPASAEQKSIPENPEPVDAAQETDAQDGAEEEAPVEEAADDRGLVSVPGAEFAEIPIHEVRENPRNPRTMFDDDELDELAHSLREVGVLQPVVVRPISVTADGESFELVMGERRWRAARRAGLQSIPAIIRETSDDDLLRDALLENLHRSQLNPLEEANAYQQLLDDFGCTQDELGDRIGRSRPQITNTLRLLRLPALVQRRLASGALSAGHARALLSLDEPRLMEELAQRIVQEGLSVRAVERLVARGGQQQTTRTVRRSTYDPHVVDLTSRLSNRLEAPVRIDVGKRKGRITLEFTNLEDLERLVENIGLDVPLPTGEDRADS